MKKKEIMLEDRTARLTILIDPDKKKAFEDLCSRLDTTPSQAMRQMIREYLAQHNVIWAKGNGQSKKTA
jgi:antitoxin component of RelBE/YafQ-DinJ toxin-antitoxin module